MTIINNQEDLLRALSENPEWRAAVRAQILGDELLELPVKFDAFVNRVEGFITEQRQFNEQVNARFDRMDARFDRMDARLDRMDARFDRMDARFDRMDARFDRMEGDISVVKGGHARTKGREAAEVIPMDLGFEYVRTLSQADLARLARDAGANLPAEELKSFREADLVVEATEGADAVYVAVEISYTAALRDATRARRNAGLLTRFTGHRATPTIASVRNDNEVSELIGAGAIHWHQIAERDLQVG